MVELAYKRQKNFINEARMMTFLYRDDKKDESFSLENLWHIFDIMAYELENLSSMHEEELERLKSAPLSDSA